jgi:two-component system phosphate regulon sensor histidine kinase PhoR
VIEDAQGEQVILAGLYLDDLAFIQEVVARKFADVSDENFIFAVTDHRDGEIVYLTDEFEEDSFEKTAALWILPELDLQIKLRGTTLEDITRERTHLNLAFLAIVNGILLIGIWYLLRNVSAEMSLARMKTDFVANVSHELRTPLTLIRMFAETLEMGRVRSSEKKRYYYRTIVSESARLTQLINNILDFSRLESHKKSFRLAPARLDEIVAQTLDTYKFHLEQKKFRLVTDIQAVPPLNLDAEAIQQALVNLLDNAIKYSLNDRRITVSLKQQTDGVTLSVQDLGIGIPESEQKKILAKFYRVGSSLVHNTKGSGLGLSLVKHIMDIHRGQIRVTSQPGVGSTFSLIFPLNSTGETT